MRSRTWCLSVLAGSVLALVLVLTPRIGWAGNDDLERLQPTGMQLRDPDIPDGGGRGSFDAVTTGEPDGAGPGRVGQASLAAGEPDTGGGTSQSWVSQLLMLFRMRAFRIGASARPVGPCRTSFGRALSATRRSR